MTRSIRLMLLPLLAAVLLIPKSWAQGGLGGGINCTVPTVIRLVGNSGGAPDATAGRFTVVARDLAMNPIAHASVLIGFESCTDLAICADQLDADATVYCAEKLVRKLTDASGAVTFTILGHSNGAGGATMLANAGNVYVNGALIRHPTIAAFDLDGSGGVGAGDLSAWLSDFGSGVDWARSEYDGSGTVGASDLSEWLTVFGAAPRLSPARSAAPRLKASWGVRVHRATAAFVSRHRQERLPGRRCMAGGRGEQAEAGCSGWRRARSTHEVTHDPFDTDAAGGVRTAHAPVRAGAHRSPGRGNRRRPEHYAFDDPARHPRGGDTVGSA